MAVARQREDWRPATRVGGQRREWRRRQPGWRCLPSTRFLGQPRETIETLLPGLMEASRLGDGAESVAAPACGTTPAARLPMLLWLAVLLATDMCWLKPVAKRVPDGGWSLWPAAPAVR